MKPRRDPLARQILGVAKPQPEAEHRIRVIEDGDGWRARCTCGFESKLRRTPTEALRSGTQHVGQALGTPKTVKQPCPDCGALVGVQQNDRPYPHQVRRRGPDGEYASGERCPAGRGAS